MFLSSNHEPKCSTNAQFSSSAPTHGTLRHITSRQPRAETPFCRAAAVKPNPVGYQTVKIPQGYSIFTPTFQCTDSSKSNTVGDIIVLNAEGNEFDGDLKKGDDAWNLLHVSSMAIQLRKVQAVGGDVTVPMNYSMTKGNLTKWGSNSNVELFDGEGVIVNNTQGSDVYFRIAGQVNVDPLIEVAQGYSVLGNATPVDMTIGDITVLNKEGNEFDGDLKKGDDAWNLLHVSSMAIQLRKVQAVGGDVTVPMNYSMTKGNLTKWGSNSDVELKAGEALVVNNTQGSKVYLRLKKPTANK